MGGQDISNNGKDIMDIGQPGSLKNEMCHMYNCVKTMFFNFVSVHYCIALETVQIKNNYTNGF